MEKQDRLGPFLPFPFGTQEMSFPSFIKKTTYNEGVLNLAEACTQAGRSTVGCVRMTGVSQHKASEGLSALVLVLDRKFLEGKECVCSTMACAITMCLKRKD